MKTSLTPEQSQRLIELGVDPSKASGEKVFVDIHPEVLKGNAEYAKPWGFIPIFTLTDILSLLPRIIKYGNRVCRLKFQAIVSIHDGLSEVWQVCYTHTSCKTNKEAPELIDALFELLC